MTDAARTTDDLEGWAGVFPAVPTPFTANGEVDEDTYRAILEDNIAHGVHGFWCAGGTGEGGIMNDRQRAAVARIAGETCQGRVRAIMHVGAPTTASAVAAARVARDAGCAAVCCVPPFFYRPSERAVIEHYQRVADAAELPFFAYNLPQLTQVPLPPDLMARIQRAVPRLVGLKHSDENFSQLSGHAALGLRVFCGDGQLMLPALTHGAIGIVDSPPALAPWTYVALYDAFKAGDLASAQRHQDETQPVTELARRFGTFQHNAKVVIGARIGRDCGAPLAPVDTLTTEEAREVLSAAEALGLTTARA